MAADDVQLPDLEVIQRYSLAVRGASAPRADVIAALRSDLDWLTSGGGRPAKAAPRTTTTVEAPSPSVTNAPAKTKRPAKAAATPPAKAPAKTAADTPRRPKGAARRTSAKDAGGPDQPTPTSEA